MAPSVIERWHHVADRRDTQALESLIADDAIFYSPVVHTPQVGKKVVHKYLSAAFSALMTEDFRYSREVIGDRDAALEFVVEIDGTLINGVDIISWNEQGLITAFKVMIRPLKGVNLVHQKMAAMLERMGQGSAQASAVVSQKSSSASQQENAMIKVSVMYPHSANARFDHDYYRDKHMPLLKKLMGDSCQSYTIDKGVGGGSPGAPPVFVAMCHIFCESLGEFQKGFGPHAQEILDDVRNYTDIRPQMQISEVVIG